MTNIKWISAITVFLLWTTLSVFSGYHLKKDKICPEIEIKDSVYTIPLPPRTAQIKERKQGYQNFAVKIDSNAIKIMCKDEISKNLDSLSTKYNIVTDSTIVFKNEALETEDSLDFVADIWFELKSKTFDVTYDFVARFSRKTREVAKEVLIPMKPEIYQEPLVITLIAVVMFLFGLAL